MEVQVAEIKLRAPRGMGELSKMLEKVITVGGGIAGISSDGKPKEQPLNIRFDLGTVKTKKQKVDPGLVLVIYPKNCIYFVESIAYKLLKSACSY